MVRIWVTFRPRVMVRLGSSAMASVRVSAKVG